MKTKTITLAGTAIAAVFAAALVLPAQAATGTQSNASAKEITRQLNEGQMQHPGIVDGKKVGPANAQYSQNGTSSEDMNGANGNDRYNRNTGYTGAGGMHENGNTQMHENEGAQSEGASVRQGISLTDVPNARTELQSATIETRTGQEIGTVQSVEVDADGTPRAVQADVDGRRVSIDPNDLVYVKENNALVTDLTKPEIENLPPAGKSY